MSMKNFLKTNKNKFYEKLKTNPEGNVRFWEGGSFSGWNF